MTVSPTESKSTSKETSLLRDPREAGFGTYLLFSIVLSTLIFSGTAFCSAQFDEARVHADHGLQLARSGDLQGAENELRQAIKLEPRNPEFLSTLGTLLAREKKLEESSTLFRKALQLAPQDSTSRRYLAANLWQLHRYPEAKQELQTLLRQHPNDAAARLLLGMVSENSGDYSTAAKMLSSVPDEVLKQPESVAALARSYYQLHERERARTTLSVLSAQAAKHGVLLGAQIADQAEDFETAQKLLESVPSSDTDFAIVQYRLALVEYHAKRFAESQSRLQRLIDSGHETSQAYHLLGWSYQQQANLKAAAESFERAIALAPADESNYLDLGRILLAHGSLRIALDVAKRAAIQFPNSVPVFDFKGGTESRMFQFTDAIRSYKRATQLDPSNADVTLGLARAQASAGLNADAASTLDTALNRFPKDARFQVEYALMLIKQAETGDAVARTRAEKMLRSALAIAPTNQQALYELGNLELNDGRVTEASRHLEQVVKLAPLSSQAHFALARAYRRLKRVEDAQKEMDLYNRSKEADSRDGGAASHNDEAKN
jgi:tetratricopeptide (TPR) repeat protein